MVRINEIEAHLADEGALAQLLASIPFPLTVGALVRKPFFARRWNRTEQRDCWLASDGDTVRAVTIHGASAAMVARIRSRFDDLRSATAGLELSSKAVQRIADAIVREERHLRRPR